MFPRVKVDTSTRKQRKVVERITINTQKNMLRYEANLVRFGKQPDEDHD